MYKLKLQRVGEWKILGAGKTEDSPLYYVVGMESLKYYQRQKGDCFQKGTSASILLYDETMRFHGRSPRKHHYPKIPHRCNVCLFLSMAPY